MISALCWIPRGAARRHPVRYEMSEAEVQAARLNARCDGALGC